MKSHGKHFGVNRTGASLVPLTSREMLEGATEGTYGTLGDSGALASVREIYAREASPYGSVPVPPDAARPAGAIVYLDKLSGHLAFERTGVRLYEQLLTKYDVHGSYEGGPARHELGTILAEELGHFEVLRRALQRAGGDPTAVSPYADLIGVATSGWLQVLADPRSDLVQSMHMMLFMELADTDGWAMLLELAGMLGDRESAGTFRQVHAAEARHLAQLRGWVVAHQRSELGDPRESPLSRRERTTAHHGARP